MSDHLRLIAMGNELKKYSSSVSSNIHGSCQFPLPFPVRKDIDFQANLIVDGSCIVSVNLRAMRSE